MAHRVCAERQRSYFSAADEARFRWQTDHPVLARREAELAQRALARAGERLLEIGCGEGANLHHLRHAGARRFGVDFSSAKAAFARRATAAHTAVADAALLPFAEGAFDVVLIRDVLHHVPTPAAVLAEARRVLRPGGRLIVVEPNIRSPLVAAQAALIAAERGVLGSTATQLRERLTAAGFRLVPNTTEHPFPLERVLLHPVMGLPRLGHLPAVARGLGLVDRLARRLLPPRAWMYLVFEALRPEDLPP